MARTIGVMCPAITCFNVAGSIDYERTRESLEWMIAAGVHVIIGGGTCGEFFTLEVAERQQLAEKYAEWVNGRVPLYIGVMHSATHVAVRLAKQAESVGATGVMSVSPYYSGPPEREVLRYFRDIASAVQIPLCVYNNPPASGVAISVRGLAQLAKEGTAQVIKDSDGDPTRLHNLRWLVPEETSLVYGEDSGSVEALLAGADGWVAGVSNFMPRHSVRLWDLIQAGNLDGAREHWYKMLPLVNATSYTWVFDRPDERPDFIQVYKHALEYMQFPAGGCRRPLLPLPEAELQYLHRLIDELKLTRETA
jgi:4-hydroxy-tetrahydrodipicolinate synthase